MSIVSKNILDFEILDSDNSKIIVFIDASTYIDKNPEKPILEVVLPGFNQYFLVNIAHSQINVLNANTLGITKTFSDNYNCLTDLPDGIWEYTYRICPYDKVHTKKFVLRTALLNKKLNSIYKKLENTDCSLKEDRKIKNKLTDIDIFINTAKAYAEDCNKEKSSNFYQIADKFATDLINLLK